MSNNKRNLSDDFTKTDFRKFLKELGNFMTKSTGEKIEPKYDKEEYEWIKKMVDSSIIISTKQNELKEKTLPSSFKFSQDLKLGDEFVQIFGAPNLKEFVKSIVTISNPEYGYLKYINDSEYINTKRAVILNIVKELEKKNISHEVDELTSSYGEVIFGYTQLGIKLTEELPYLLKKRSRLNFETVLNFLEIYKSVVSAYVEHMIVFLYGIQQILRNQFQPYSIISKVRTTDKIKSLRNDELFSEFVRSYKNNVRNSIIHGSQYIDRTSKTVNFIYKSKFSLTYDEFIHHVQDITKDAIIIANIKNEMNYLKFKTALERLNSVNKN